MPVRRDDQDIGGGEMAKKESKKVPAMSEKERQKRIKAVKAKYKEALESVKKMREADKDMAEAMATFLKNIKKGQKSEVQKKA